MTAFPAATDPTNANFALEMQRSIGGSANGPVLAELQSTLMSVDPYTLSQGERRVLLTLTREMARDGDINPQEGATLAAMIVDYAEGRSDGGLQWPFADLDFSNAPGSALFNDMMAFVADELGGTMDDLAFMSAVRGLLNEVTDNAWSNSLWGAFNHSDLTQLSTAERRELLAMLSVAAADGSVNWAETQVILDVLNRYSENADTIPPRTQPVEWSASEVSDGRATIDLGNYTLELNERSSEIWITNKETGDRSRIWGDPHFDMDGDGRTDVDFWGTISLNLEDGTKITINTTPWKGNADMTVSSELIITNGDRSIVVEGLDQNVIGDMDVRMGDSGQLLDRMYGDGLSVYENPDGEGWLVQDGLWMRPVTQDDMNQTKGMPGTQMDVPFALYAMSNMLASSTLVGQIVSAFSPADFANEPAL